MLGTTTPSYLLGESISSLTFPRVVVSDSLLTIRTSPVSPVSSLS